MSLFGPPDIDKMKSRQDVDGLIKALSYKKDTQIRRLAADVLGDIKDTRATEPLIAAIQDTSDSRLRCTATKALAKIADSRAVGPLIANLNSSEWEVRLASVNALGVMGDARAVEPLFPLLTDSNKEIRKTVMIVLDRLGDKRAVEPLLSILHSGGDGLLLEVVHALKKFGSKPTVDLLGSLLEEPAGHTRSEAVKGLGIFGGKHSAEILVTCLKDDSLKKEAIDALVRVGPPAVTALLAELKNDNPATRYLVADGLSRIGWQPSKDEVGAHYLLVTHKWKECAAIGLPAMLPLLRALRDGDRKIRIDAIRSLGEIGDSQAAGALIEALKDENNDIRRQAAMALGKIGEISAIDPLKITLTYDVIGEVRQAAADALLQLGWKPGQDAASAAYWFTIEKWNECINIGLAAVEVLFGALRDEKSPVRQHAAEILGKIGQPSAVQPLSITLTYDHSASVRAAVAQALGELRDAGAVDTLVAALKDKDSSVRKNAAEALGKIGHANAVNPLISVLQGSDSELSRTAIVALGKIGDTNAVNPLIAILKSRYSNNRDMAAMALGEIGDPGTVEPLISELVGLDEDKSKKPIMFREHFKYALEKMISKSIDPFIAVLGNKDYKLRRIAIDMISKQTGPRAIEALTSALMSDDNEVRKIAAVALMKSGWQPGDDATGAAYWVNMGKCEECVRIGTPAVGPLIKVLENDYSEGGMAAIEALGRIGDSRAVEPLIRSLRFGFHNYERRTAVAKVLGMIGDARAVEPLIKEIEVFSESKSSESTFEDYAGRNRFGRMTASVLSDFYRSGKLSDVHIKMILEKRTVMTQPHVDTKYCAKVGLGGASGVACMDSRLIDDDDLWSEKHNDYGIGFDFPL
jgi:HEAT repeat protein